MVALLQRKRSYYLRKLKIIQRRRLARKKRQFWFTPGKTDQWWQNMISRETPEEQWVKKFRMTRKDFFVSFSPIFRQMSYPQTTG